MVGRLIVGLIWLTLVKSESLIDKPTNVASDDNSMKAADDESIKILSPEDTMSLKPKRYLSHQHSSPCPPFYPNFGMHAKMYDARPYGPPAYPKNDIHQSSYQTHQELHYVHQPTYSSYVPKQTIQYIKPEYKGPIHQYPIVHQPSIHHVQPVQTSFKQPDYHQHHYEQPMLETKILYSKQPVYSYAPAYKPMPAIWPLTPMKKYDYPTTQVSYNHRPSIVYKPDPPKCAPCHPNVQSPILLKPHHAPLSYLKVAPSPLIEQAPSKVYLPNHQSIVKPCAK